MHALSHNHPLLLQWCCPGPSGLAQDRRAQEHGVAQDYVMLDVKSLAAERDPRLLVCTHSALQSIHGHLCSSRVPSVPERPLCAPHPGCLASPFPSARAWWSSPLGARMVLGWDWPPRSGWPGAQHQPVVWGLRVPSPGHPGGFRWQQEPEAKPLLLSSQFQTGNHTDRLAGTLPVSWKAH